MRIDRRNDLDLRLIEAFAAVIERGTTPAAAEHLGLSQSAVWNAVKAFEAQLDVTLFRRKGRRLEPTDEGRLVYDDIRPLLGVLGNLAGRLHRLKHNRRGRLSVAATAPVGNAVLPPALGHLLSSRAEIEVDLTLVPTEQVAQRVELGLADVGLLLGQVDLPGVQTRVLGGAELVAVLPRDHLLTTRSVLGPADLVKSRLISAGPVLTTLVEGAYALQGIRYQPQLRCDQAQSACALVNAGLGVAVVDPYSAAVAPGSAIVTRKFSPVTRVAVVAVLPDGAAPDPMVESFLTALAATVVALGPAGWG